MQFAVELPPTVAYWNLVQNGALFNGMALSVVLAVLCYVPVRRRASIQEALTNPAVQRGGRTLGPILLALAGGLMLAGVLSTGLWIVFSAGRLVGFRAAVAPGGFESFSIDPQARSLHGYATVHSASFRPSESPMDAWNVGAPDQSWSDSISVPRSNPEMSQPMRKLRGFIFVPETAPPGPVSGDLSLEVRYPEASGRRFINSMLKLTVRYEFEVSSPSFLRRTLASLAELGLVGLFLFTLLAGLLAAVAFGQLDLIRPQRPRRT